MANAQQGQGPQLTNPGYGSRVKSLALIALVLSVIAALIAIAAIWANSVSDEPEIPPPVVIPAPTVTPSPTPSPRANPRSAATPELENTPSDPDATPTATPTETPIPTPTRTPTPTPTPTPTYTPTPTPTPSPPLLLEVKARTALIDFGIDPGDLTVSSVAEAEWHDLALGCSKSEGNNPAMDVRGWIVVLEHEGMEWTFHLAQVGDEDVVVNCTDLPDTEENLVNLAAQLNLYNSERVIFSRRTGEDEFSAFGIVEETEAIAEYVETLDIDIAIGDAEPCLTAYKLEFHVDGEAQALDFFCREEDWFRIGGNQEFWGGKQGSMPEKILQLISPFLAGEPLPGLPPPP